MPAWALGQAIPRFWVFFSDRGPEAACHLQHPEGFLSEAALNRRLRNRLAITEAEVPPSEAYQAAIRARGAQVVFASRWLNAAVVEGGEIPEIQALPFVIGVHPVKKIQGAAASVQGTESIAYGAAETQNIMLNLQCLHNQGFRGQGVRIGWFDNGFNNLPNIALFDSLWNQGRVAAGYDFQTNSTLQFTFGNHGTQTISMAAANRDQQYVGAAPLGTYYLARTEVDNQEKREEEWNWLAAAEWADANGVDVINSSLGYNTFDVGEGDYTFANMDGNTTIVAKAASWAAQRGIVVVNSAGNEGTGAWGRITSPCDADSILCVGAVTEFGNRAVFSSRGPAADGRIKPDVAALGQAAAFVGPGGQVQVGNGTSFAAPLVASMAACLLSKHPFATAMQVREAIIRSGSQFANPDSLLGFGIPDACSADSILATLVSDSQLIEAQSLKLNIATQTPQQQFEVMLSAPDFRPFSLQVLDVQGRVLQSRQGLRANVRTRIPMEGLAAGVYILRAAWDGGQATQRMAWGLH